MKNMIWLALLLPTFALSADPADIAKISASVETCRNPSGLGCTKGRVILDNESRLTVIESTPAPDNTAIDAVQDARLDDLEATGSVGGIGPVPVECERGTWPLDSAGQPIYPDGRWVWSTAINAYPVSGLANVFIQSVHLKGVHLFEGRINNLLLASQFTDVASVRKCFQGLSAAGRL